MIYNGHLNPRPYRTSGHVKFHIQKRSAAAGFAECGGVYPANLYSVFSPNFVKKLNPENQCQLCLTEFERLALSADSLQLSIQVEQ